MNAPVHTFKKVMQKPNKPVAGFEMFTTCYRFPDGSEVMLGAPTVEQLADAFRAISLGVEPDAERFQQCVLVQRQPR